MKTFAIIFSNYTGNLFAWEGNKAANKRYLGNRDALGEVSARTEDEAIAAWRQKM